MKKFIKILIIKVALILTLASVLVKQPVFFTQTDSLILASTASATRLKNDVLIISEKYYPRSHENIENLNKIAAHTFDVFSQSTPHVSYQNFNVDQKIYKNVRALWGQDPQKERIVIGAHYDSFSKLPAADDNASGMAVLLELSRLLQQKSPTQYNVELVAYSLEEPPYFRTENMGSFIHAQSLQEEGTKVNFMISLETLGYYSKQKNTQDYPSKLLELIYPNTGDFAAIVGDFSSISALRKVKKSFLSSHKNLKIRSITAPSAIPGIDFSDHLSYWKFGIPALMITDTAFYRNKFYHSLEDTPDILNYENMALLTEALHSMLLNAN